MALISNMFNATMRVLGMNGRNVAEVSGNVFWVGVRDWNRRLFDALIPLPRGTTYNAYLIVGENQKALVDTVNPGFEKELVEKVGQIVDPEDVDFFVMNHAEPDHAGAIPHLLSMNNKAMLVTSRLGSRMAQSFYKAPEKRIKIVSDGETIDLGGKGLRFIEAPMLHWPETMFTYLQEDKILFSCDFFGSHVAKGLYDEEVEDLAVQAQRYFGEIMMPFRTMAEKALGKISGLNIDLIAPSHGPLYKDPQRIIEAYGRWAHGETKPKAAIIYVSMWNSTEKMISHIAKTLESENVEVALYNLTSADLGDLAKDLVDSRAVVFGTPTVLGGMHPLALYAASLMKALRPPTKFALFVGSYGWGGGALRQFREILDPTKIDVVGALEVQGPPSENDLKRVTELGKVLADKIREVNKQSD
jgi:flavorubredoxin